MTTRAEQGLLDPSVQAAIRLHTEALHSRLRQINYFRPKGGACRYLKSALKLAVWDLKGLGYQVDNGIVDPGGNKLWPRN